MDDEIMLPADTLNILNQFLIERAERERKEQELILSVKTTSFLFEEDWQLSQFWYNNETRIAFQNVVKKLLEPGTKVGLLSCPSLYRTIKDIYDYVKIFEFDKRFSVFGEDFIFYDFNDAFGNPKYLESHAALYDIIIADPPFLSEECISKTAHIIKLLKKNDAKVIVCSGEAIKSWVEKYLGLRQYNFRPEHERNLANQFISYANFNIDEFL